MLPRKHKMLTQLNCRVRCAQKIRGKTVHSPVFDGFRPNVGLAGMNAPRCSMIELLIKEDGYCTVLTRLLSPPKNASRLGVKS